MVLFRRSGLLNNKNLIFLRPKNHKENGSTFHIKFSSTQSVENFAEVQLSDG